MADSHTSLRIRKLKAKGLTDEQIARKIGRPTDVARVQKETQRGEAACGTRETSEEGKAGGSTGEAGGTG